MSLDVIRGSAIKSAIRHCPHFVWEDTLIFTFRTFLRFCVYVIFREKYELFPSYKSILCDSKLGYFFDRYRDTKSFNSKFMLKGHDFWKYKLKSYTF